MATHGNPRFGANALDVGLGNQISERRIMLGLTQAELGHAVGVSAQQIQKYEHGLNRVSFSTLVLVSHALQCRVADLVRELDEPPVQQMAKRARAGVGARAA